MHPIDQARPPQMQIGRELARETARRAHRDHFPVDGTTHAVGRSSQRLTVWREGLKSQPAGGDRRLRRRSAQQIGNAIE
jgi:hypothetical protein